MPDEPTRRSTVSGLVRTARPHQWTKNALVFAAPLAGGVITDADVLLPTGLTFVAFCLASSSTYLLNDALDVEADRRHPTKCRRPIAAGQVRVTDAYVAAAALLVGSLAIAYLTALAVGVVVSAYLALTLAYSFGLKRIPVVDLVVVAAGFVLRAVAGAAAANIPLSEWFFIVVSAGALLMVTGKREGELAALGSSEATRASLEGYTHSFLVSIRSVAAGLALIAYCLWTFESQSLVEAEVAARISIAPFTVAILRYTWLIDHGRGEEPERLLFEDRILLATGATWAIIYGYAIYLA
ncbi:MAG: decaprenyl-phosphate phosphoribosyltransferase [Acidimicrobiia bacterium]|nr:decaprenyl-phosphate phosphoribosyltransferase [Acidimicrobiia bacterium]